MAQKVQVFRRKQEQKPQQEPSKAKPSQWAEVMAEYQQWLEQLKQEDPARYEALVNAPRTDETPPCVDPDWDPAEMET